MPHRIGFLFKAAARTKTGDKIKLTYCMIAARTNFPCVLAERGATVKPSLKQQGNIQLLDSLAHTSMLMYRGPMVQKSRSALQ